MRVSKYFFIPICFHTLGRKLRHKRGDVIVKASYINLELALEWDRIRHTEEYMRFLKIFTFPNIFHTLGRGDSERIKDICEVAKKGKNEEFELKRLCLPHQQPMVVILQPMILQPMAYEYQNKTEYRVYWCTFMSCPLTRNKGKNGLFSLILESHRYSIFNFPFFKPDPMLHAQRRCGGNR